MRNRVEWWLDRAGPGVRLWQPVLTQQHFTQRAFLAGCHATLVWAYCVACIHLQYLCIPLRSFSCMAVRDRLSLAVTV
jgi:hypothetical protein